MKNKRLFLSVFILLVILIGAVPVTAKKPEVPSLAGSWIGSFCTKEALPIGAMITNLQGDSLRSFSGPVAIGIPGLEVVDFDELNLTIAESGRINAVSGGTFMTSDDRVFQVQFSFNGDYLETGAIIANGTLHLSGPTSKMTSEEVKLYIVSPELTGWVPIPPITPFPPKEDIDLNNLNNNIIETALINYFGGLDMGSYTLSQDLATYFGGQDMGSYVLTQGAADYFGGQDMGSYTIYFGGQDMGTYLTKTYIRRFVLNDDSIFLNVELSEGGSLDFVVILIPKR